MVGGGCIDGGMIVIGWLLICVLWLIVEYFCGLCCSVMILNVRLLFFVIDMMWKSCVLRLVFLIDYIVLGCMGSD